MQNIPIPAGDDTARPHAGQRRVAGPRGVLERIADDLGVPREWRDEAVARPTVDGASPDPGTRPGGK
jgi:hypothetical protein